MILLFILFHSYCFPLRNDFYHKAKINRHLTSNINRLIINQKLQGANTAFTNIELEFILAIVFCATSFRGSGLLC